MSCSFRSVSVRSRLEVGFEDRLQDELERPLDHAVTNRRNREDSNLVALVKDWKGEAGGIPLITTGDRRQLSGSGRDSNRTTLRIGTFSSRSRRQAPLGLEGGKNLFKGHDSMRLRGYLRLDITKS